jgi:hypothetical protein
VQDASPVDIVFAAVAAAFFVLAIFSYPILPACVLLTSSQLEHDFLSLPRRKKGKANLLGVECCKAVLTSTSKKMMTKQYEAPCFNRNTKMEF